jgi:capsular exopolysaccharide synthesis family protein
MTEGPTIEVSHQWQQFVRVLRRRAVTALVFFTVTSAIVTAGTLVQVPVYRASSTVLIDMENPAVLAVSRNDGDPTIAQQNYMTYADYYRTQLEIMGSRALAKRVFYNLKLGDQEPYTSARDKVGKMMSQVAVEPIKQTRLAKIRVEDTVPERAAAIANELGRVAAEENLLKTVSSEAMTLMKNEFLKLQARQAELSKRYKAKHPAMIRLREEMTQLAATMEAQRQAMTPSETVAGAPPAVLDELAAHPLLAGSIKPNNIRVQDSAQVPGRPFKPKKAVVIGLGLLLALLGSLALVVIQELLDSSVKSPEDVEKDSKLTLLGYVPRSGGLRAKPSARGAAQKTIFDVDPYSEVVEAYRTLRTSFLHSLNGKAPAVVVTSPGMSEGKTTTVSNLGIALAESGLRVLLVDADMRKGRLHEVFSLQRKLGLSELLSGRATVEEVIKPTGVAGLSIITTGALPKRPAELLGAPAMKELVPALAASFDRVLIDTPPVIAVTDAAVLAAITQTVMAVAQSGRTPRQALHRISGMCRQAKAKFIGVVLNNVAGYDAPIYARYAAYRYAAPEEGKASRD